MTQRTGVCSWSLQPTGPEDLAAKVRETGADAVQLALDPIRTREWDEEETVAILKREGIAILSGMMAMEGEDYSTLDSIRRTGGVRLDATWEDNRAAAADNAALADRLGVGLVTFHAGFLPHESGDPVRGIMIERLRTVADRFAAVGIDVGLETGQETAETLLDVLEELARPRIGVNFDPANMILYGMGDPIASLEKLAPYVRQVHIKDAAPTSARGEWGTEVPVGKGFVDWEGFFDCLTRCKVGVDWIVEREAGDRRVQDVRTALTLIERQAAGKDRAGKDREVGA